MDLSVIFLAIVFYCQSAPHAGQASVDECRNARVRCVERAARQNPKHPEHSLEYVDTCFSNPSAYPDQPVKKDRK